MYWYQGYIKLTRLEPFVPDGRFFREYQKVVGAEAP